MELYQIHAKKLGLRIELVLANEIPKDLCLEWNIYTEILFHLMQNAVKFSDKGGLIRLTLSYHPVDLLQT